jgi:hypothetical protein
MSVCELLTHIPALAWYGFQESNLTDIRMRD